MHARYILYFRVRAKSTTSQARGSLLQSVAMEASNAYLDNLQLASDLLGEPTVTLVS